MCHDMEITHTSIICQGQLERMEGCLARPKIENIPLRWNCPQQILKYLQFILSVVEKAQKWDPSVHSNIQRHLYFTRTVSFL